MKDKRDLHKRTMGTLVPALLHSSGPSLKRESTGLAIPCTFFDIKYTSYSTASMIHWLALLKGKEKSFLPPRYKQKPRYSGRGKFNNTEVFKMKHLKHWKLKGALPLLLPGNNPEWIKYGYFGKYKISLSRSTKHLTKVPIHNETGTCSAAFRGRQHLL